MRCVLGLLVLSLASAASAEALPAPAPPPPVITPEAVGQALHDLSRGVNVVLPEGITLQAAVAHIAPGVAAPVPPPPVKPDLALPAPVPVERDAEPTRIRISPQAYSTLITEPPVIEDEAAVSAELLQWRDHLEGKKERRIERGADVGGLAAIGVRLGSKAQADAIVDAGAELLRSLQAWNDEGALVISVVPGSPAERAGIIAGDVVVQYGGIWIDSSSLLVRIASRAAVEREQDVWVWRAGGIERLWMTPIDRRDLEKN